MVNVKHRPDTHKVYRESAEVVGISTLPGAHCRMRLRAPKIAAVALPGQFVNISPPIDSAILRRPLGVYRTIDGTDIEVLFKAVGRGTIAMMETAVGRTLDIIGPLGNGFDLTKEIPETAILVAGGFGIAPLYPLALALKDRAKIFVFVGTEEDLPVETSDSSMHASFVDPNVKLTLKDFEEIGAVARVATLRKKDGYFEGLVTELLEKFLHHPEPMGRAKVFACGPWLMMKRTAAAAAEHKLACEVLLEERMGCGIGACMSCAVRVFDDNGSPVYVRACIEGPVFDATKVDWSAK